MEKLIFLALPAAVTIGTFTLPSWFSWDLLFALIALIGIIGALIALWRGIYHTSCKFIVEAILIIVMIFAMPGISASFCSIDPSGLINKFAGKTLIPAGTTVDVYVIDFLHNQGLVSDITAGEAYTEALSLAHSIVGLVLFFLGMFLLMLLGWILSEIIYSFTFQIFIPKEKRKTKKHRAWSMLEGFICSLVVGALFISPLTFAANMLTDAAGQVIANEGTDSSTGKKDQYGDYQDLIQLLADYKSSAYYKTMHFGSSNASAALDSATMSKVTALTVSGTATSLSTELSGIISLIPQIASYVHVQGQSISIDYDNLLAKDTVTSLLTKVEGINVLVGLLPALGEIGANYLKGKLPSGVEIDLSGLSSSDYKSTIDDLNTIYASLYDAGLINYYVIPQVSGEAAPTDFQIKYENKAQFKKLVETALSNTIIKKNLPSIMAILAQNMVKSQPSLNFLPLNEDAYSSLDWSTDLSKLVDFVFDAFQILNYTSIDQNTLSQFGTDLADLFAVDHYDSTTDKDSRGFTLAQYLNDIKALFCGGTMETFKDSTGAEVKSENGLLSLDLFSSKVINIPKLVTYAFSSASSEVTKYISSASLSKLGTKLQSLLSSGDTTNSALRSEFGNLLDVVPEIYQLVNNTDSSGQAKPFDLTDASLRLKVYNLLSKISKSTVVKTILPDFVKSALSSANLTDALFGLTIDDFDLTSESMLSSVTSLFKPDDSGKDLVGKALDISNKISAKNTDGSEKTTEQILAQFQSADLRKELKEVLVTVCTNSVLNPDRTVNGSTVVHNSNLSKLVNGLLTSDSFTSLGLTIPSDLSSIVWYAKDSGGNESGELISLVDIIGIIADNASFLTTASDDLSTLDPQFVKDLYTAIGKSNLLKGSLPSILDSALGSAISGLGVTVNFYAVTDWSKEGTAMAAIVTDLKSLGVKKFSDIDYKKLTGSQINALLTSLSETGMLSIQRDEKGEWVDMFGSLAYTLISKANLTSMVGTSLSASTFSRVQNKYAATAEAAVAGSTFVWSGGTADSTYTYEYKNEDGTTTIIAAPLSTSGEICAIGNIFDSLEALIPSGSSDPDFTNMTKAQLSSLLKSLNASSVFHSALPSLLDYALSKATSASSMVDLTYINTEVWGGGNAIGDDDIDSLVYLYSEFTDTSSDSLITKLTSYSDDFSQVPSAEQDAFFTKLEDFLNALAGNSLMNTVKTGKNHSFLDEVLGSMLHKTTLDEMITDEPKASAEEALTNYLAGITDWIFITDDYTTYTDTEKTTIDYAATSTLRSSSAAQNASEVLRLVHVIRTIASTGISLDSLSDPSKLEASQLEAAFLAINNSEVLHPAVSSLFDKVYKAMNFKTEYNEDGTVKTHSIFYDSVSGLDYRVINTDINRTYSKAAVSFWENEIDYFSQLFTALKNAGSLSTGSMSTSSFKFYDLLKPIDNMYTLRNEKEYIVLHMLSLASQGSSTVDVTSYLRDLDASSSFTSNSKTAARISSLLFWPGHTDDDLKTQCAVLDSFIAKATNLVNVDFTKGDQVSGQVFDLFMSTFSFTLSGTSVSYVRGYLAQEILAGLLKDRFSVANGFASAIATQMASIFYAADSSDIDYQYLNIIETRGLEGVLSLSAITTADYNDPVFVAALEKAFTLMGRNSTTVCYPNTTVTDVKYEYLLDQTEAKAAVTYTGAYALSKYRKSGSTTEVLCNSRLAITLFETYIGQVNATIGSNTVSLKLICDKYNAFCEDTAKKTTVAGILTAGGNTAGAATIMGLGTKDEILPEINTMENNGVNIIAAMNYYALYGSYM